MPKAVRHVVAFRGEIIGERASARVYTHAVVAIENPRKVYAQWVHDQAQNGARRERSGLAWWGWERKVAQCREGDPWPGARPDHGGQVFPQMRLAQYQIDIAKEHIAKYPTVEVFLVAHRAAIEGQRQKQLDVIAAWERGEAVYGPFVARWSQSEAAARKAMRTEFQYADLFLAPVARQG